MLLSYTMGHHSPPGEEGRREVACSKLFSWAGFLAATALVMEVRSRELAPSCSAESPITCSLWIQAYQSPRTLVRACSTPSLCPVTQVAEPLMTVSPSIELSQVVLAAAPRSPSQGDRAAVAQETQPPCAKQRWSWCKNQDHLVTLDSERKKWARLTWDTQGAHAPDQC